MTPERIEKSINPKEKKEKEEVLKKLGFRNKDVIDYLIKEISLKTLQQKIQLLEEVGFQDPVRLIEKFPPLAALDIQRVIQSLKEVGFENPVSLIEKHPQLAAYNIQRVIQSLKEVGFKNPVSLIKKFPPLAGYNIQRVIQSLKDVGFENPVSLIEKHPQLAGYNIQRVIQRIKFLDRLIKLYKLKGLSGIKIIEEFPPLLSYNIYRIIFYLRVLREINLRETLTPNELVKRGKDLLIQNPFLVFYLLIEERPKNFNELNKKVRRIKRLNKDEKQKIIKDINNRLPDLLQKLSQSQDEYDKFLLKLGRILIKLKEVEKRRKQEDKKEE